MFVQHAAQEAHETVQGAGITLFGALVQCLSSLFPIPATAYFRAV